MINLDKIMKMFGYLPEAMVQRYASLQIQYSLLITELQKELSEANAQLIKLKKVKPVDLGFYGNTGVVTRINPMFSSGTFIADNKYLVFSKSTWMDILTKVRNSFYLKWKKEISDCDNFASIMCAAVQKAFIDSGFEYQGAFGYAIEAGKHAFNVFVADGEVYVYEPQNNIVKGLLGQTESPYNANKIFFIG